MTLSGSWSGHSFLELVTPGSVVRGQTSLSLVAPVVGTWSSLLVTPPQVCEESPLSGVPAGDTSSGVCGESASASGAVGDSTSWSSESIGDSSSLVIGRGINTLLSAFTWALLWR